jgi:glycine/D-amino acid oxidase-like deaminating enzyme
MLDTKLVSVDVVVVGSGVVGSIMSMELASAGLSVVCLEHARSFDVNTDLVGGTAAHWGGQCAPLFYRMISKCARAWDHPLIGGSCRFSKGRVGIGDPVKSIPEPGTERTIVDCAADLEQQISAVS